MRRKYRFNIRMVYIPIISFLISVVFSEATNIVGIKNTVISILFLVALMSEMVFLYHKLLKKEML